MLKIFVWKERFKTKQTVFKMANVMAVNQTTKAMDAYAITTDKGKFSLN
jgi:hypothetical protein